MSTSKPQQEPTSSGVEGSKRVIVISGPSGSGKTTICDRIEKDMQISHSISATTRAPRPGEKDGQNYLFLSREQFMEGIKQGEFLEHAELFSNLYGTPREPIEAMLAQSKPVLVDVDVQGAMQLKKSLPDALYIFIVAPSKEELHDRLKKRHADSEQQIAERLRVADREMEYQKHYDHVIVNKDIEKAVEETKEIIRLRICTSSA